MKKIFIYLFFPLSLTLLGGCINDKGNYDYDDPDNNRPIITSELEESYDAISLNRLVIEPKIKNERDDYEYLWYIYSATNQNLPNDTIGREKNLNYLVTAQSGRYRMVLKVTDPRTGTSDFQSSALVVSSNFGKGYYIMKYEGGRTDIDFVNRDGELQPNILKQLHGEDMPGQPIRSSFSLSRYCYNVVDDFGNVEQRNWQSVYIVCTDEDLRILNGDDLSIIKTWETAFADTPAVRKPQGVWCSRSGGQVMINDNAMHMINGYIYSDGTFGYPFHTPGFEFSDQIAVGGSVFLAYDRTEGTFAAFSTANGAAVTHIYAGVSLDMPVGYDLIWSGGQPYSSSYAYALIRNREDNNYYVFEDLLGYLSMVGHYITGHYPVPASSPVTEGTVFACMGNSTGGNTALYYSTGNNVVSYYKPNTQEHRAGVITIGAGEEIIQLQHIYINDDISYFVVLARSGQNWKLYVYDVEYGTMDVAESFEVYSGTGQPGHVICREPTTGVTF